MGICAGNHIGDERLIFDLCPQCDGELDALKPGDRIAFNDEDFYFTVMKRRNTFVFELKGEHDEDWMMFDRTWYGKNRRGAIVISRYTINDPKWN